MIFRILRRVLSDSERAALLALVYLLGCVYCVSGIFRMRFYSSRPNVSRSIRARVQSISRVRRVQFAHVRIHICDSAHSTAAQLQR